MSKSVSIAIEQLDSALGLPLPSYETAGSAGADLSAAEAVTIEPGERQLVGTGLRIALPQGFEAQIRPRSGLALRHGVTLLNTPGTIDSDYRGEIRVLLINLGDTPVQITRGMRIAQLVLARFEQADWVSQSIDPEATARGAGGFGSTDRVATKV